MELERARAEFERQGARIVAISTDTPRVAAQTRQELGLGFTIIPDHRHELLKLYDHRERYSQLQVHNPAVYIVDRDGIVRWRHFGRHAGDRPSPAEIWRALRAVQGEG